MPLPPISRLDSTQVLPLVLDEAERKLRVDASVSMSGAQEVIITHLDDSIKIGDGADFLGINPDGSINAQATLVDDPSVISISQYNEELAVVSGSETSLLSYTVPASKTFFLHRIEVSGTNIAEFKVKFNSVDSAKKRTYWGRFNEDFEFTAGPTKGIKFVTGDTIEITVLHNRPTVGDFNTRLQGLQVG